MMNLQPRFLKFVTWKEKKKDKQNRQTYLEDDLNNNNDDDSVDEKLEVKWRWDERTMESK